MDTIVCVDRNIKPVYPVDDPLSGIKRINRVIHPEFETSGPPEFDVRNLELWTHPNHPTSCFEGFLKGSVVYEFLQESGQLFRCLNVRDLEEIEKKGFRFFTSNFDPVYSVDDGFRSMNSHSLYAPKSIIEATNGRGEIHLFMPSLRVFADAKYGSYLGLRWSRLCDSYSYQLLDRTPLFPKEVL